MKQLFFFFQQIGSDVPRKCMQGPLNTRVGSCSSSPTLPLACPARPSIGTPHGPSVHVVAQGSGLRNGSGLEVSISCKVISILAALRGVLACGSRQGHCGQQHQRLPGLEGVIETQVTVTKWLPFSQALRLLPAFSIDVLLAPVNSSTTVDGAIPRKNRYLVVALVFTPLFSIHKYCYVKIRNLKLVDQSHYSDHQIVLNTSWIRNTTSFLHT